MFKCGICHKSSPPYSKPIMKTLTRRLRTYLPRPDANHYRDLDGKITLTPDNGGKGWEIVKEVMTCKLCA